MILTEKKVVFIKREFDLSREILGLVAVVNDFSVQKKIIDNVEQCEEANKSNLFLFGNRIKENFVFMNEGEYFRILKFDITLPDERINCFPLINTAIDRHNLVL